LIRNGSSGSSGIEEIDFRNGFQKNTDVRLRVNPSGCR